MTTFRTLLSDTEQALASAELWFGHGYDSAHDEAVALVLAAADLPAHTGAEILEQDVTQAIQDRLSGFIRLRVLKRQPTAYIIGRAFLGPLEFISDARALVPRSPLMALIAEGFAPWWQGGAPTSIIDVCCGGGSLGLLAAWAYPDARVGLLDIDRDALALAAANRAKHGLTHVKITQGDLLSPLKSSCADIILANPPYVDAEDMASLPDEYLHEPRLALAAGVDGLALVHRLLTESATVLKDSGVLFLEVGNSWRALEAAYPTFPFVWLELESGGHGICALTRADLAEMLGKSGTS